MYSGVASSTPATVIAVSSARRARPKSVSHTTPSPSSSRFDGFTSR
jgi:hypothetical protein